MSTENFTPITEKPTDTIVLEVQNLQKRYGKEGPLAVKDISMNVREREFISIVGPSGCGKTTLLKTVCNLLEPSSGQVVLRGRRITSPPRDGPGVPGLQPIAFSVAHGARERRVPSQE
jgi:ABC-type Fe3+/spermidine/putrescine transport system ATPase subunit